MIEAKVGTMAVRLLLVSLFVQDLSLGYQNLDTSSTLSLTVQQPGLNEARVLRLRGAGFKPRVLSVQDFEGWKNVSTAAPNNDSVVSATNITRSYSQVNRSSSEEIANIPFSGHSRLIELIRKNRRLAIQVKSLRSRAVDDETKLSLDKQLKQLDSAWEAYVRSNPAAVGWQQTLERAELVDQDGTPVRLVPVTFTVYCNVTNVGDKILVMGDVEEMGAWRESGAIVMNTDPETFPVWNVTVLLKGSDCVEYKYAIGRMGERGTFDPVTRMYNFEKVEWEGHMGNRGFKVPRRAHLINDTFVDIPEITENWRSPRFLRMHRVDSSELFLEPEYAMIYD